MSVMITGATGFIGMHVARLLREAGHTLHVLARPTADLSVVKGDGVKVFHGDIMDRDSVARAMDGCDRVFHLAAYAKNWAKDGELFTRINVGAVTNILECAHDQKVQGVVFTSTNLTMSTSSGLPVNESTPRTTPLFTDYEVSKTRAEAVARTYAEKGVRVVMVNPSRVFGPGLLSEGNSTTIMMKMYMEGAFRTILGNGEAIGNWAFVDDVARGHLLAMENGRSGERYILGGENASFNRFFDLLAEVSGDKKFMLHVPKSVAFALAHAEVFRGRISSHHPLISPGWVRIFLHDWEHSIVKAQNELGYSVTPLREAMTRTVQWLRMRN